MDKIEKIRQEIERRRLHFNKEAEKYQALNNGYSQNCYGARDALRDLENFLDTLSEENEQTLFEEIAYPGSFGEFVAGLNPPPKIPKMKVDKDLEEAAEKYRIESYRKSVMPNTDGPIPEYSGNVKGAFIAGAEWQKKRFEAEYELDWITDLKKDLYELGRKDERERMMKDAVEGTVMDFSSKRPRPQVDVLLDPHKYHTGDKVRIIIVKEK